MTATDDIHASIAINQQKYWAVQERLRQALSPETVGQHTITEQQAILTELYRESEKLAKEYRILTRTQAEADTPPE